MELSGTTLKVTTSDLETTLVGSIEVDSVETEGTIAAPAKLMLDSLKEFPELPLEIDVNDKNWEIRINWKSGSLSIPGASAVSYPAVPQLSAEKKEIELDVDTLVNGINKTIFATADDELRPVMNGIYINLQPESLTFVGTDAHKAREVRVRDAERGLPRRSSCPRSRPTCSSRCCSRRREPSPWPSIRRTPCSASRAIRSCVA